MFLYDRAFGPLFPISKHTVEYKNAKYLGVRILDFNFDNVSYAFACSDPGGESIKSRIVGAGVSG
jgi:hypothetical protein